MKFDLVGKELQLTDERGGATFSHYGRLISVTDGELVLEFVLAEKTRQVRYTRE